MEHKYAQAIRLQALTPEPELAKKTLMRIIADTHVHLHECHDLDRLLNAAAVNLAALATAPGGSTPSTPPATPVLFLTERRSEDAFRRLAHARNPGANSRWTMEPTPENAALVLRSAGPHPPLYLIAGRQVITRERLEVLALATDSHFADGLGLRETLAAIVNAGGFPVLPWSPGKWWFQRGRIVRALLLTPPPERFLLGDVSARPAGLPAPALLRLAHARGFPILAGTDPLPLPGEEALVGTYASQWDQEFDSARPVTSLRQALANPNLCFTSVGRRCPLHTVLRRLLALRRTRQPRR